MYSADAKIPIKLWCPHQAFNYSGFSFPSTIYIARKRLLAGLAGKCPPPPITTRCNGRVHFMARTSLIMIGYLLPGRDERTRSSLCIDVAVLQVNVSRCQW